jgi:hypothetical protein
MAQRLIGYSQHIKHFNQTPLCLKLIKPGGVW